MPVPSFIATLLVTGLLASACATSNRPQVKSETEILQNQKSVVLGYLDTAQPKRAHAELRTLLQRYPNDADLNNLMGLAQLALDNKTRALTHFRIAYKQGGSVAAALNLSSVLIDTGKVKEAEKILKQVQAKGLENYPYPERLEHNLGFAAEKRKDLKTAEKHYVQALQENPGFYLSLSRLGGIYERTGRETQALAKYDMARLSCNVCYDPVKAMVRIHLKNRQTAEATNLLKEFAKTEKISAFDKTEAMQNLSRLTRSAQKDTLDQKAR